MAALSWLILSLVYESKFVIKLTALSIELNLTKAPSWPLKSTSRWKTVHFPVDGVL